MSQQTPMVPEEGPNLAVLMNVHLQVTAQLGSCTLSVREILEIGTGAVVELDRSNSDPVDLLVNDKPVARGEIVAIDDRLGVRITELVERAT